MSYAPTTDFLALLRNSATGEAFLSMPGLDYLMAAMARAGMFSIATGQSAPTTNQSTTVWIRPSVPSWVAEGTVFLWNAATGQYEAATIALWGALLAQNASPYVFQSVSGSAASVNSATSLLAIQRTAPTATALTLPAVSTRAGKPLSVADWSTSVSAHVITLTPAGSETIMQRPSLAVLSSADQLAGVTLRPSVDLKGWIIAS